MLIVSIISRYEENCKRNELITRRTTERIQGLLCGAKRTSYSGYDSAAVRRKQSFARVEMARSGLYPSEATRWS